MPNCSPASDWLEVSSGPRSHWLFWRKNVKTRPVAAPAAPSIQGALTATQSPETATASPNPSPRPVAVGLM